jgi:hypothetical protein
MNEMMCYKSALGNELLITHSTIIRSLTAMYELMSYKTFLPLMAYYTPYNYKDHQHYE